jgi:SagB-type dehydrogenase family enzyme
MTASFTFGSESAAIQLADFLSQSRGLVFSELTPIDQFEGRPAVFMHGVIEDGAVVIEDTSHQECEFTKLTRQRRSAKEFSSLPIPLSSLTVCLSASTGVTNKPNQSKDYFMLASPSAGNLIATSVWIAVRAVQGLKSGVYFFERSKSMLVFISSDIEPVYESLIQPELRNAAVIICIAGSFERSMGKYGLRGARYVFLEGGHIAQNLCLSATEAGLAVCTIGGFLEDKVNTFLGLNGKTDSVFYCVGIGASIANEVCAT